MLEADPFPDKCHLFWVSIIWQSAPSDTVVQPVSSWAFLVQHWDVFSSCIKCRETH